MKFVREYLDYVGGEQLCFAAVKLFASLTGPLDGGANFVSVESCAGAVALEYKFW